MQPHFLHYTQTYFYLILVWDDLYTLADYFRDYYQQKQQRTQWKMAIYSRSYRILIIGGSGSEKTNTLLNLIKEQDNRDFIDKICIQKI